MEVPVCLVCFYERDGVLPPSRLFDNYESALAIVTIRQPDVECVMLDGDMISRGQTFKSYEAYMKKMNTFQKKTARAIFYRVVGPYRRA
jgi:hypothetical protein